MIRSPLVEFPNKKTIILHYGPDTNLFFLIRDLTPTAQRVRAFVDFLVKRFEGSPYWDLCLQNAKHAFKNSGSITPQDNIDQFNYTKLKEES